MSRFGVKITRNFVIKYTYYLSIWTNTGLLVLEAIQVFQEARLQDLLVLILLLMVISLFELYKNRMLVFNLIPKSACPISV